MSRHLTTSLALTAVLALTACAHRADNTNNSTTSATPAAPDSPNVQIVKSTDGSYTGELVGTPKPGSKFSKLKIGMTLAQVQKLIKAPDALNRHETGKRWIPFYFGNDSQRLQAFYEGEGCLTYTGGNVFGGGANELIRITADPSGACNED